MGKLTVKRGPCPKHGHNSVELKMRVDGEFDRSYCFYCYEEMIAKFCHKTSENEVGPGMFGVSVSYDEDINEEEGE